MNICVQKYRVFESLHTLSVQMFRQSFLEVLFLRGLSNRCYLGRTVGQSNNVAAFRKWANHRLSSKHQFENRPKPIASELFIAAPPKNKIY